MPACFDLALDHDNAQPCFINLHQYDFYIGGWALTVNRTPQPFHAENGYVPPSAPLNWEIRPRGRGWIITQGQAVMKGSSYE